MTREEKIELITYLIQQPGNLAKVLRKNITDSLTFVADDVLDKLIEIIESE